MPREAFDKALIVANPTSGSRKAVRWFDRVVKAFRRGGWPVEPVLTEHAGHGRQAANNHEGERALLIAFGGDGTFNELLNGADPERTTLAIIPAGTGNVLANELGMSHHPLRAVGQLLRGRPVTFDVGLCNGRRFVSVFGAGIDGAVVRAVHEARRGKLAQFHYVPHAVRAVLERPEWGIRVEVDGRPVAEGLDLASVGNTHSYGGPIEMTSAAAPDDGLLDVMCLPRRGVVEMAQMAAWSLLHALHRSRRVHYVRGRSVRVGAAMQGVPYQVDGEPAGTLPAEIIVVPRALGVLAPADYRSLRRKLPAWRSEA